MACSRQLRLAAHAGSRLWREWPRAAAAPISWALRKGGGRGSRRGGAAPRPDRVAQLVGARGAATGSRHGEAHGEQRPRATRLTSVGAAQATSRSLHSASSPYTERRPVGVMGADKTLGPLLLLQVAAEPGPKPDLLARREEGSVPEGGGDRESRTSPCSPHPP